MTEPHYPAQRRGGKGRKFLMTIGILLIVCGVFMGAFACSFQVMIQAAADARERENQNTLAVENRQLKEDVQRLEDQITVLEGELDRYKAAVSTASPTRSGSSGNSSGSSSGNSARRTVDDDDDYDYDYDEDEDEY